MIKVFIVDDEPSVVEGLKIMVPWGELEFDLCGVASNGLEALKNITALRPHLVITDIRMPGLNGLELINEVQKIEIDTEFVILSGYADFSYVQEAMRMKVLNYMLKPLEQEEVLTVLHDVKKKFDNKFFKVYGFSPAEIDKYKTDRSAPEKDIINTTNTNLKVEPDRVLKLIEDNFDEELITAIKLMNSEDSLKLLDEMFTSFKEKNVSLSNASILINSCIYSILQIAHERNIKIGTILPSGIINQPDFESLKNYITNIISQIIDLMLEERRKNSRSYLYEVKEYIDKNYEKDITVSFLADMVFLEAGYLGDAFNKQFGLSISEYQHRLRIEKAIELIQTTDKKLSDISANAGYNNYNNFFAHFVRITSKKPTEYQRRS